MSEGVTKDDLASFFGAKTRNSGCGSSNRTSLRQNSKDLPRGYYAETNQSLVWRILRLEAELVNSRKQVEELRKENELLKKRMEECGGLENAEKIEALVEERIKRKMDKLGHISRRTIAFLNKSASTLKNAFEDFGIELIPDANYSLEEEAGNNSKARLTISGKPHLDPVSESPPLVLKLQAVHESGESCEASRPFDENETPTGALITRRPRRSELFVRNHNIHGGDYENDFRQTLVNECSSPSGDMDSAATPSAQSKRPVLDTPAIPWMETDTVRRKRTATMKIKTLAEPKLNSKLRRPGRNDEPIPFISSENY
ncbi:Shugoshin [Trichostrongylus colubriformis]|uniref:Shugoshin n=1 Tax=Trichostrongylus colubriformis TaxID=6319 RepID=A0AAN8FJF9_TRICO